MQGARERCQVFFNIAHCYDEGNKCDLDHGIGHVVSITLKKELPQGYSLIILRQDGKLGWPTP
jgi:hypothetical protein